MCVTESRKGKCLIIVILFFIFVSIFSMHQLENVYAEYATGDEDFIDNNSTEDSGSLTMNTIQSIIDEVNSIGSGSAGMARESLLYPLSGGSNTVNSKMFSMANNIMKKAVMPIAYSILALFLLIELLNVATRREQSGGVEHIQIPFVVMFKAVICKTVLDMTSTILSAIYEVTLKISTSVDKVGASEVNANDISAIETAIENADLWEKPVIFLQIFVIYLIVKVAMLLISVIIIGRFIQLYLMTAVAPIPIATLPHYELSQIGKNFLKNFTAVCLQGTLILVVLAFFPSILSGYANSGTGFDFLWNLGLYMIILVVALFGTQRLAKSVCNAM